MTSVRSDCVKLDRDGSMYLNFCNGLYNIFLFSFSLVKIKARLSSLFVSLRFIQ